MPYIGKQPATISAVSVDTDTGTFSGQVAAASLDISGNVDVDGVLETDNLTIGGAQGSDGQVLTSTGSGVGWEDAGSGGATSINGLSDALVETNSIYIGQDPSSTTSTAQYNFSLGTTALDAITTGDQNVAIGKDALTTNTTGFSNVAIGYEALRDNLSQEGNVAIGMSSLQENRATYNTAIGNNAMRGTTDTNITGGENVAIGAGALKFNISGERNVASGRSSLYTNTTGSDNAVVGKSSLFSNTTANYNTAIGNYSLYDANRTSDTDGYNTALGYNAGNTGTNDITTGNKNTLLGASTAASAAAGTNQTVIGYGASGKGDNTVTIGNGDITAWSAADDGEVDLGSSSVEFKDLYVDGVAYTDALGFGTVAMTLPTADGSANQVLKTDGSGALSFASVATSVNGLSDALIEDNSLYIGQDPSSTTSTAEYNVSIGATALDAVTTGDSNTALGYDALTANEGGGRNTAIGSSALKSNTTGITNVAVGSSSLERNTTSNSNTAVGHSSSYLLNSGASNVTVGYESGKAVTSANNNVIIGSGANPSSNTGTSNQIVVGYGASGVADNSVTMGNSSVTAWYPGADNTADLGSSSVEFKDLYIDGTANLDAVDIDGGAIDGAAIGANSASTGAFTTITASTSVDVSGSAGLILENDETITNSTDGTVVINGIVSGGTGSAAGVFTSNGDQDVTLQTGNSTTGSIMITDGANGNIAITPNGSGAVQLDGLSWPTADGSANQVLKTDGSGALSFASVATSVNGLSDALTEDNSTYIGQDPSSTTSTAEYNVSVGITALDAVTTGDRNTAIGYNSLTANDTGKKNTAVGYGSMTSNTSGQLNTVVGHDALEYGSSGNRNTAIGFEALRVNSSSYYNTGIGSGALTDANRTADTDGYNTALGYNAGNTGTNDIITGNKNTLLGSSTAASAAAGTNQTVIGFGTSGKGDNTVTIGNGDITLWSASDDDEVDLGSSSVEFKDLYIDGTANLDAVDIDGGAIDGAAIGANSAFTGAFTTVTASTSLDVTGSAGVILENDETITNSSDGTVLVTATTTSLSGDLTVTGNDIVFGNSETISNSTNGTVAITATTTSISGDLTVTGNDITFGNSESISNTTDGTVLINGEVSSGTGSAAGVFKSNGDNDLTLKTGNSTTGSITMTDGANGDIAVAPNGTGETTFGGNPISNYSASTVTITGATTLATSHNGKVLICNSGSNFSLTIPEDTLPAGFNIMIVQKGSGEVTLAAASGNVTINNRNSHTKTANQWAIMSLICIDATTDANVFVSGGDGAS